MKANFSGPVVLAGDIGATKTNLGIFEISGTEATPLKFGSFSSQSGSVTLCVIFRIGEINSCSQFGRL